ncbi:MAG: ArsA family ATPase [Candidatus Korobacteraceae bacterium]
MFTFFIGKGGVGKTTVSSAYALHRAATQPRRPILLLSTDPAHSLADVLQVKLSDKPKRLQSAGRVWARQIDPKKQIDFFLRAEREGILALLNQGSLFTRGELEPLLDTSLPGMAEVAALLAIRELLDSEYEEIVVDTAPMGHAIRLFQMPEHFARFLDVLEAAASRDIALAQHFGGRVRREPALKRWEGIVEDVKGALSAGQSKLVLVTTAESFSLKQAVRSAAAFETGGSQNRVAELVLNRVVIGKATCPQCRERAKQNPFARKFLRSHFPEAQLFRAEDRGCPILGVEALRDLGAHIFSGKKLSRSIGEPPQARSVKLKPATWPKLGAPLTLTLGKGGVGKTTISAALAYHHRETARRDAVCICSIDPAPSLDDVFEAKIGDQLRPVLGDRKLRAAEFDAMSAFQQWAGELRARLSEAMSGEERGIHLDLSLDRKFLLALLDVVPPGVDEIFAIFRILDLLRSGQRVVIDMAPTGHALEVLRTPERLLAWSRLLLKTLAAHRTLPFARDAAVEVATLSQNVRELASILRDAKRCQLVVVTLPEPLPDHETRRLLGALAELGAPLGGVFVNRVLIDGGGRCSRCKLAARWQAVSLGNLRRHLGGGEIFVAPEFAGQIAGRERLEEFTQKLWQVEAPDF